MAVCVQLTPVYAFNSTATSTAATNRVVKSDMLQAVATPAGGLEACSYVALTGTEFGYLTPHAPLTIANVNEMGAAIALLWATAWVLRRIRKQIPN